MSARLTDAMSRVIIAHEYEEAKGHIPEGLTERQYLALAVVALDQSGLPLAVQARVLHLIYTRLT